MRALLRPFRLKSSIFFMSFEAVSSRTSFSALVAMISSTKVFAPCSKPMALRSKCGRAFLCFGSSKKS